VFARILNSMFPRRLGNFIADFVQPNPDLWGPFWLSTTLIFSIAIVGNLARFLQTYGSAADEYTSDFSFGQFLCTQNRMGSCRYFLDMGIWKIAVFRSYGIMSYGITSSLKYQYQHIASDGRHFAGVRLRASAARRHLQLPVVSSAHHRPPILIL